MPAWTCGRWRASCRRAASSRSSCSSCPPAKTTKRTGRRGRSQAAKVRRPSLLVAIEERGSDTSSETVALLVEGETNTLYVASSSPCEGKGCLGWRFANVRVGWQLIFKEGVRRYRLPDGAVEILWVFVGGLRWVSTTLC